MLILYTFYIYINLNSSRFIQKPSDGAVYSLNNNEPYLHVKPKLS